MYVILYKWQRGDRRGVRRGIWMQKINVSRPVTNTDRGETDSVVSRLAMTSRWKCEMKEDVRRNVKRSALGNRTSHFCGIFGPKSYSIIFVLVEERLYYGFIFTLE